MGGGLSRQAGIPGISFTSHQNEFLPLDLVCFRGNDLFNRAVTAYQEYSDYTPGNWTHVGLLVTPEILPFRLYPGLSRENFYVWESTLSCPGVDNVREVVGNTYCLGVQVRSMSAVVNNYLVCEECRIGIAPLKENPLRRRVGDTDLTFARRKKQVAEKMAEIYAKYHDIIYEYNVMKTCCTLECINSDNTWDEMSQRVAENSRFFCSYFISQVYSDLGLLDYRIDPAKLTPEKLLQVGLVDAPILIKK